ncbi:MAG: ATP-dependent nuclease [Clostridium baratii]
MDTRKDELEKAKETYKIIDEKMKLKLVCKKGNNITSKYYIIDEEDSEILIKDNELKKLLPELKVIPAIRDPKNESTAGSKSYLKDLIRMLDDENKTDIVVNGEIVTYNSLNDIIAQESSKRCSELSEKITGFYGDAIGNSDYEVVINSEVNISNGTKYTTKIRDRNTGIESDVLNCGTGYQSMIILSILEAYVEITQNKSKYILLIEEPEVYLHPSLQRKMIDTLISISENNQVLFTSHSPITVSKVNRNQIKLVKKQNGIATIEEILPQSVINELGIRPDDILSNKGTIIVEGKDDKAIFEILLEKIRTGLKDEINVVSSDSCTNLKFYANAEVLINNKFSVPVLIVRDSDAMDKEERRKEFINELISCRNNIGEDIKEKLSKSVWIVENYSIESYFIDYILLEKYFTENKEKLKKAIKCYECQYNHYAKLAIDNTSRKLVEKYYQPKLFLEIPTDKVKKDDSYGIRCKLEAYKKQWVKFEKCKECDNNLEVFFEVKEIINAISSNLKSQKSDLMIKILEENEIQKLKDSKIKGLINVIEEFVKKI